MIILSCDVSYTAFGLVLYDTSSDKVIRNETIKFRNLSSLNKQDKELFNGLFPSKSYKELSKDEKEALQELWCNIRLSQFYNRIIELNQSYKWEVVIAEKQFSSISDVFAVVRLASTTPKVLKFIGYRPSTWHKILFGYGAFTSDQVKQITKDKLIEFGFNLNSQDEYDALALIFAYLKKELNYDKLDFTIDKNIIVKRKLTTKQIMRIKRK